MGWSFADQVNNAYSKFRHVLSVFNDVIGILSRQKVIIDVQVYREGSGFNNEFT
jgi:hypothetical protein